MQDYNQTPFYREPNCIFKCFHVCSAIFFGLITIGMLSFSIELLHAGMRIDGSCYSNSAATFTGCD